jgi:hypothetical protein
MNMEQPNAAAIEITLAHDSRRERQTRDQLLAIAARFDLTPWIITRRVIIEERAIPHSHPVLTLNTRHIADDDLLLATFLHEQAHWRVLDDRHALKRAIAELGHRFPGLPVGHPRGGDSDASSYLHVVVNFLEWRALRDLVGDERARAVMEFWCNDHYTELYRLVLTEEDEIARVVKTNAIGERSTR